jgi:hypothetical protein
MNERVFVEFLDRGYLVERFVDGLPVSRKLALSKREVLALVAKQIPDTPTFALALFGHGDLEEKP